MKRWIVLSLCAALIAGCGGDDGEAEPAQQREEAEQAEAPSPEEERAERRAEREAFIAEADAICQRANRQVERLNQAYPEPEQAEYDRVLSQGQRELDQLDVPAGLETKFRQYRAAVDQQRHFERMGDYDERDRARDRKGQIALDIGFAVCGTG